MIKTHSSNNNNNNNNNNNKRRRREDETALGLGSDTILYQVHLSLTLFFTSLIF